MVLAILSLTLILVGTSYSFFQYAREGIEENSIKIGDITFKYTENELESGISITDGFPVSDEEGKLMQERGNYFDFQVDANLSRSDLEYEVVASLVDGSTMPLETIKLYLTEVNGDSEKEIAYSYREDGSVKILLIQEVQL